MIVECATCHSRYNLTSHEPGQDVHCRCGAVIRIPEHPASAGSLSCPQCGAACSPDDIRCAFCNAHLAVLPCPRCFDLLFIGTKHCPNCGAEVSRPAYSAEDAAISPRQCPRCGVEKKEVNLVARIAGDTLADQCPECGGVWLDMGAFDSVLSDAKRQTALRALGMDGSVSREGSSLNFPVAYLKCPDCGTLMHRKNFGKRSGIIIDTCKDHGVWCDRGELARVLDFVASGGLELAQKKELEALKEEVARQKAAMRPPSWYQAPAHEAGLGKGHPAMTVGIIDLIVKALHRLFRGF